MLISKNTIGSYSSHFQWRQHRCTNTKKKQYPVHGGVTSHLHRPKMLEMGRPEIGCYIGNKTNNIPSPEKERQIPYLSVFLGKLNKVDGQWHGAMIQAQQIQQQPTATPSAQAGHMEFYSDWVLAALMGYDQVYTETCIP